MANPDELDDIATGCYKNAQSVPFLPKARRQLKFTNWLQSQGCVRKRQSCLNVDLSTKECTVAISSKDLETITFNKGPYSG